MTDIRRRNKAWFNRVTHKQVANPFSVFTVGFVAFLRFRIFGMSKSNPAGFLKNIKDRDPVFPDDSIQTSVQEYLASQSDSSCNPFEKEEKRACLYSVRLLVSVIPMQAYIQVLCTSSPQQFLRKSLNAIDIPPQII